MSNLYEDANTAYLDKLCLQSSCQTPALSALRARAEADNVPIIGLQTAALLDLLVRMNHVERVLEIGCAVGYSSILTAQAAGDNAQILTVDIQSKMIRAAQDNIRNFGLEEHIFPLDADARVLLHELVLKGGAAPVPVTPPYDMIFLDGPKAHYVKMLDDAFHLLRPGGLLIADNVLYKGMTADNACVKRRKITIVKRLRRFLDFISRHPKLQSVVLPIGDGVSVSYKTGY